MNSLLCTNNHKLPVAPACTFSDHVLPKTSQVPLVQDLLDLCPLTWQHISIWAPG